MSASSRVRICEKKIKTAETKVLRILSKIDNLKLNDSYKARLCVRGKNKSFYFEGESLKILHKKIKKLFHFLFIGILLLTLWWIYKELSNKVRNSYIIR